MAVHDHRGSAIVLRPRVTDREPELVGLTGGLSVERERSNGAGGAALHLRAHAGMRDHELPVVEHEVAHQSFEELGRLQTERLGLGLELLERVGEAVRHLDVRSLQGADELPLVVPGNAERGARLDHRHHGARTAGVAGPRSTRSPRKTALRPPGWRKPAASSAS